MHQYTSRLVWTSVQQDIQIQPTMRYHFTSFKQFSIKRHTKTKGKTFCTLLLEMKISMAGAFPGENRAVIVSPSRHIIGIYLKKLRSVTFQVCTKKILLFAASWPELEDIKSNVRHKRTNCIVLLLCGNYKADRMKVESGQVWEGNGKRTGPGSLLDSGTMCNILRQKM